MKTLIIGQAPPAVKQEHPYDTTLLYDMFYWIGITKSEAQKLFEFEALVSEFPGFNKNGHAKPSKENMFLHFKNVLDNKIYLAEKIILLGNESKNYLMPLITSYGIMDKYLFLPHPSKRNYKLILDNKELIINFLKTFLNK